MGLNKVILQGNLTADPELRTTPNGAAVVKFTMAVQRNYKNASGDYESDFININAWKGTAEFVTKHFKKGDAIAICGAIQTRSWTTSEGNKRYSTEVVADEVFFASKKKSTSKNDENQVKIALDKNDENQSKNSANSPDFEELSSIEDLPF
jgi:single-strand DNA-binding protein